MPYLCLCFIMTASFSSASDLVEPTIDLIPPSAVSTYSTWLFIASTEFFYQFPKSQAKQFFSTFFK